MNQNPETETTTIEEKGISEEKARGIFKGDVKISELNHDELKDWNTEYVKGGKDLSEEPNAEGTKEPEAKVEGTPDIEVKEAEKEITPQREMYDQKNELNTLRQKIASEQKRLDAVQAEKQSFVAPVKKDDEDYIDPNVKALQDQIDSMRKERLDERKRDKDTLEANLVESRNKETYLEISQLQFDNPELRTSETFQSLNQGWSNFTKNLGGKEAADKFISDPEFRKSKEDQGMFLPMSDKDFKLYTNIVETFNFKKERNHADLETSYVMWQRTNGVKVDPVSVASQDAAKEAARQVMENKTETVTLTPGTGHSGDSMSGSAEHGMTPEAAMAWMRSHPFPKTKQERETQIEIMHKFGRG